jgi:hypothetical protein
MQYFSKFAGASMVAFLLLSFAMGSAICHMGDCGKYAEHCSIHQGIAVCTSVSTKG